MSKTCDLHLHSMDRFDSQNNPEAVCKKEKELGATAVALTQHGVVTEKKKFREAAEACGLKFIPGIEAYVKFGDVLKMNGIKVEGKMAEKRCHLILLACDYTGDKAIDKAICKSQDKDGYAVMSIDILEKYFGKSAKGHGHVIATSACIQGVIAMTLRLNDETEAEIAKLERQLAKYDAGAKEKAEALASEIAALDTEIKPLTAILRKDKENKEALSKKEKLQAVKTEKRTSQKALAKQAEMYESISSRINGLKSLIVAEDTLFAYAGNTAKKLVEIFGEDNFFMEMQYHCIEKEKNIYPKELRVARSLNIPLVATNDVHIVEKSQAELLRRQILKAMRFKDEEWKELSEGDEELYIKTDEEMAEMLCQILPEDAVKEAMENIMKIVDRCNVEYPEGKHYPKFHTELTADEQLDIEIEKGIRWRFPEGLDEEHQARLDHELPDIKGMGYSDYHLIVKDILEYNRLLGGVPEEEMGNTPLSVAELESWVKERGYTTGFSTGPGRGSAVGSLVCYLLGITSLDPLKYDLLFERFLNPERVSMPDIDSDLSYKTRGRCIEYIKHKYGENAVCAITTKNIQAVKKALKTAAKYYAKSINASEKVYGDIASNICKLVPAEPGIKFSDKISKDSDMTVEAFLRESFPKKEAQKIIDWAVIMEGSFDSYGTHAAGVIISDNDDVSDYIPLRWNDALNIMCAQYDAVQAEEEGLLKIDCLGLRTLDVITDTIQMIEKNHGIVIDPLKIDLADADVYKEIFKKGMTNSVFQFESPGMKQMLRNFAPENFEDLIILVSMYRPGPLQYIDKVIEVKKGKTPEYLCPELEPILGKTYGAIVYQEQVMEIFQKLAGYSLGGADIVRRYMSKKKKDKLAKEKDAFIHGDPERGITGCVGNGIAAEAAEKLFEEMEEFAKYAFNKSHAAAYAFNAYVTGWLKYHYPSEFMASAMNWATNKKIGGLMHEAKLLGLKVKAPCVNMSSDKFAVIDGDIYFGLKAVKSVGASAQAILKERNENGEYTSLRDFITRCNPRKDVLENLCKAGALDCFSENRKAMGLILEDMKNAIKTVKERQEKVDEYLSKNPEKTEEWIRKLQIAKDALDEIIIPSNIPEDMDEKLSAEKELLGMYVTAHPADAYQADDRCTPIDDLCAGTYTIQAVITSVDIRHRKADGKEMAFCTCEDASGEIKVNFFTKKYAFYKKAIKEGNVLLMTGRVDETDTGLVDENEEPIMKLTITPDSVKYASKKKVVFRMNVSSYPVFHIRKEADFRREYESTQGCLFEIFDEKENRIRRMSYKVSPEVKNLSGVVRL